jgi:hypothetical protein
MCSDATIRMNREAKCVLGYLRAEALGSGPLSCVSHPAAAVHFKGRADGAATLHGAQPNA